MRGQRVPLTIAGHLRFSIRALAIAALLITFVPLHYAFRLMAYGSPFPMLFLRFTARVVGARVESLGTPLRRDVFFIANHVSWIDILALAGASGTAFVAKRELSQVPVIVVTAGLIEDEWLATVPVLAARAQARLASLSSNAYQVVAPDSGHFVHRDAPDVVLAAIETVVSASRSGSELAPCAESFVSTGALCVPPGGVPELAPA